MRKYEEQVARGIAALDADRPGWRAKIDYPSLNFSTTDCVIGQVYGKRGPEFLLAHHRLCGNVYSTSVFGFYLSGKDLREWRWQELKEEWGRQLGILPAEEGLSYAQSP